MFAWMNRDAGANGRNRRGGIFLPIAASCGTRAKSPATQKVREIRIDCDNDVVLLKIEQVGGIACHTGRAAASSRSIFADGRWEAVEPVLKDPKEIYK